MKKNKRIITTAMGAAVLGGGITITAVAQSCSGDSGRNTQQDIATIVNSVNELSNYSPSSSLSRLSSEIINSLNSSLLPANSPPGSRFIIQSLDSIVALQDLVSVNQNGTGYTLTGVAFNGNGSVSSDLNNFYTVTGSLTLTVNIVAGSLSVTEATGLSATSGIDTILVFANVFNSYVAGQTIVNPISNSILASIQTSLPTDFVLSSIAFEVIGSDDVETQGNTYNVTINNVTILGTLGVEIVATSFGSLSFIVTEEQRTYSIGEVTLISPTSIEQSVIQGINELSNYNSNTSLVSTLAMQFLAALNNTLSGTVQAISFQSISSSDISISQSNTMINVSLALSGSTDFNEAPLVEGIVIISISINEENGQPEISEDGITGLSQSPLDINTIVGAVNQLNGYSYDDNSNQTVLSLEIIFELATIVNLSQTTVIGEINSGTFNEFTSSDIQEESPTSWRIEITANNNMQLVGRILAGRLITLSETTIILQINFNNGVYEVNIDPSNTSQLLATATQESILIGDINSSVLQMYNGSISSPITRRLEIAEAIISEFENLASPVSIAIASWTYPIINIFNVSVVGNDYSISLAGFTGSATSNSGNVSHVLTGNEGSASNSITLHFILDGGTTVLPVTGGLFI